MEPPNAKRRKRKQAKSRESFSWKKPFVTSTPGLSRIFQLFPPQQFSEELAKEKSIEVSSTSDYSSCSSVSEPSRENPVGLTPDSVWSDRDWLSDVEVDFDSDSDSDLAHLCEGEEEMRRDTRRTRTLRHKNVTVVIPEHNLCGYNRDEFYLEFINDVSFVPHTDCRTFHISEIVSVEPHGARFSAENPALIYLPVTEKICNEDRIFCLCSNTPRETTPVWEHIPQENFTYKGRRVLIKANHFSLFTVVVERPFPEVHSQVTSSGKTLRIPEVPGIEVDFPAGILVEDITAYVRVLYDAEPASAGIEHGTMGMQALASSVIMVGPHGCQFNPGFHPVTVRLPIPHYLEITRLFGQKARLSVWQSSSAENEPVVWERLDVAITVEMDNMGLCSLCFPVSHFSFFKVLWDILSSSLYEAKLGVAYFYPFISFSMMCHAWMEENKDTRRFGLEVICYRSDKKLPDTTNYKYKVGSSLKPKLIRPGGIIVKLKSELFEADLDAGEDKSLFKLEPDFRGREFEKQFACRFKQEKPVIERGIFGKVVVERKLNVGENEPIFEFNLYKSGCETEPTAYESSDRWSIVAIKELAGTLHIMEDNNWKKFARHIGFTKNEIHRKLMYSPDPFLTMVNLYQSRGGTPEEFVQALYQVSRQLNIQGADESSGKSSPGSASSSGQSSTRRRWNPFSFSTPTKWRSKTQGDSDASTSATETSIGSRKRSNPSGSKEARPAKKKRRFSDVSETMSSSEESCEDMGTSTKKLEDTDMWEISALMNTVSWRALGRTLGLEESVLLNIEHTHKTSGFRECAYQMLLEWKGRKPQKCTFGTLHTALCKENMNNVAKELGIMKLGDRD
ncbi:uncharacterized protein LOC106476569 [Limulus polyphemus]|uniref:Uncharacterized protein LOC106476569 n=1 Tax=Limulus polyphemus TaxID=6850 RepID=A0ABM1S098_LIMPO|nr:uncharacterized protein LOC106476569 [Limulus polyphemus]XP_022237053.1 uncharacterized protein LOC106476569 [Limulus polyphemus]XP_022237056.1 uncharacterized protein LOC106476569 [Limulus polyphemus]XP_022237057.1 uncharacterized protein LOC106476569 [Limulus polyphemus]